MRILLYETRVTRYIIDLINLSMNFEIRDIIQYELGGGGGHWGAL